MPVTIQDVLRRFIQKNPGVVEIPLANIRFDPENPGTPITAEQIQELADDMDARGQQNPVSVMPHWDDPLAQRLSQGKDPVYPQNHPRGPQGEGQALGVPGQGAEPQNGPGPLVPGAALHPDNLEIKADGTP